MSLEEHLRRQLAARPEVAEGTADAFALLRAALQGDVPAYLMILRGSDRPLILASGLVGVALPLLLAHAGSVEAADALLADRQAVLNRARAGAGT